MTLKAKKAIYLILLLFSTATNTLSSAEMSEINSSTTTDKEPEFEGEIQNATVSIGREAILSCSVTGLGNYKLGWMKAEDQTILTLHNRVITHNGRVSVTNDDSKIWHLHIRQVKESDKGCYMCQINTNVMKKQLGCIDVHIPPDINDQLSTSDVTVDEGHNATLICQAVGHPKPRITWKREDGRLITLKNSSRYIKPVETLSGEKLELVRLDRHQMGTYLCIASNDVPPAVSKRVSLNINFAPIIKVEKEEVGGELYKNVSLVCHVQAFPYTTNFWIKRNENQILQKSHRDIDEVRKNYIVHSRLTISFLTLDDFGAYTCIASNFLGRAERTIYLHQIIPSTTRTVIMSTTFKFTNFGSAYTTMISISEPTLKTPSKVKEKSITESTNNMTKSKQKQKDTNTERNSRTTMGQHNSISTRSEAPFLKFMSSCGLALAVNYALAIMTLFNFIDLS